MKKSVFCATLLVAGLSYAGTTEVANDYVVGVLPVTTNQTSKTSVILSIPWVQEGGGVDAIAVTNLIKTAGLDVNDKLTWYDTSTGKYQRWQVVSGADDVKYWNPVTVVAPAESYSTPAADAALTQGQAIVLNRASTTNTIFIVGQVGTNATVSTTVAASGYTLLAPPVVSGDDGFVDFNTVASDGNNWASCEGDVITVAVGKTFTCRNVGTNAEPSYKWVGSKYDAVYKAPIPVGQGVGYERNGNTSVTITWSNVPTTVGAE